MISLYEVLSEIPDFRRKEGQRFAFPALLEMVILAGVSGYFGINSIHRFIKNNKDYFINRYDFVHGVPSQTGLFNFLSKLDYNALNKALTSWSVQFMDTDSKNWIAIDGKAIGSTITDKFGSKQNYQMILNMFCKEKQIVISTKAYENKHSNEGQEARQLIEQMTLKGMTLTLDAVHCQKKQRKPLWWEEMTT